MSREQQITIKKLVVTVDAFKELQEFIESRGGRVTDVRGIDKGLLTSYKIPTDVKE